MLPLAHARPGPAPDQGSGELVTDPGQLLDLVLDTAFRLLPRFALALAILLVFVGIAWLVRMLLRRLFARTHLESGVSELLLTVARFSIVAFGAVLALDNLGFNVTSIIAGLGIAGVALGFAAKDTLANLIAGVTILWDRPFRVGDRIEVDGSMGVVRKITLRTTRLDTVRNEVVILPNETMVTQKIINHTMRPSLRVDVPFGIAYAADVEAARKVVLATTIGDEKIREKPEPAVVVTSLAESSVNMELRIWIKEPIQEISTRLRYTEKIKGALDAAGIEIPFPQLTLHLAGDDGSLPGSRSAPRTEGSATSVREPPARQEAEESRARPREPGPGPVPAG